MTTALFWFRKDLRLKDNPAWVAACEAHKVLPVFVLEPELIASAGPFRRGRFFQIFQLLLQKLNRSVAGYASFKGQRKHSSQYIQENNVDCMYFNATRHPSAEARRAINEI